MFTELVQNAADAANRAGVAGVVSVWADGESVHVANTGEPIDRTGVESLASLRASRKDVDSVGRFGVGFTSVLSVSDDVEIRSQSGSVRFSAALTKSELSAVGITAEKVPVLRLAWPSDAAVRTGFATEVVLHDVRGGARNLLRQFTDQVFDLLLELPSIASITVDGQTFERRERALGNGLTEVVIADRVWWQFVGPHARWLLPIIAGRPVASAPDVLRAPTRSDEELTLPVIVIGSPSLQPDRRRILPGSRVEHLMDGYGQFAAALPSEDRLVVVPRARFARGDIDALLREAALQQLQTSAWLPVVGSDDPVRPGRAVVLPGLSAELEDVLADTVDGLIAADLSGRHQLAALRAVGAHEVGLARLADLLSGLDREPGWWRRLYDSVEPLVVDAVAVEELGGLPVPLADGRTVTGPRTTLLPSDLPDDPALANVHWARLVHPDAAHPLLARLGAAPVNAAGLLSDPALEQLVLDGEDVADVVLVLAAAVADEELPTWLGLVELADDDGDHRPADELLLPDAPLRSLLSVDAPFGTVADDLVHRFGAGVLRKLGVGWSFLVVRDESPTGPDHELPDEEQWWAQCADEPETLAAVRDLDLIDDTAWEEAISVLANDPETASIVADRAGYTAWWLRNHGVIGDRRLGAFCDPRDPVLAGLLDPYPGVVVVPALLASLDDLDADFAQLLVDRLANESRTPNPAAIVRVHTVLATAVAEGRLEPMDIHLPDRVRAIDGSLVNADDAIVLDQPWLASVVPASRLVVSGLSTAGVLAHLLDLPLASNVVSAQIVSAGVKTLWANEPEFVLDAVARGIDLPSGPVVVHDDLVVKVSGAVDGTFSVREWVDEAGVTNLCRRR
ncbi:sacsin N-terminal ATP-binding-like domain-containing protein [Smaragdicoccus niigatensis]|uniref:sacsin N-terminal ATP-binding-like domain-containing protein n=1 Tax=Smaragdicoccus niigatensis TaxID=359359 RepID=UPI00035DA155